MHYFAKFLSKSVKWFLRYHNFFIFEDGGRRRLGFQKFWLYFTHLPKAFRGKPSMAGFASSLALG